MKIGLKEISDVSGFSLATVSNVLNNKKGVNEQTAKKILEIAQNIGYFKNNKIDKIKLVVYKKHGLVVDETPFFNELIMGVEGECRQNGLALEIVNISPNHNDNDFEITVNKLTSDLSSAILLLATEIDENRLKLFENSTVPIALLDGWISNMKFNSTIINNKDSISNAVQLLSNEYGYKNFGYLKSSATIYNFRSRLEGFYKGINLSNSNANENNIISLLPTADGSYKDMVNFLENNKSHTFPEIFISDNDIIALGAMKALKEFGIKIPEDVSILGFDDSPYCEISSPTLSTIRVFKNELAAYGVRNLIDSFTRDKHVSSKTSISTELILRESINLNKKV